MSDYYCSEINASESGVGEPVGLCCPDTFSPTYDMISGTWSCSDTDLCYPEPAGFCSVAYNPSMTLVEFQQWTADDGCLDSQAIGGSQACCSIVSFGDEDYYSDTDNVVIY